MRQQPFYRKPVSKKYIFFQLPLETDIRRRNWNGCKKLRGAVEGCSIICKGPHLCPACMQKLEEKFSQVKDYLEDNPHATIPEIAKDNEVSTRQIEQWVREERLYFSDDSPYGIGCERCGKIIKTGRFCDSCRNDMANTFQNAYQKKEAPKPKSSRVTSERDKMRYLDR